MSTTASKSLLKLDLSKTQLATAVQEAWTKCPSIEITKDVSYLVISDIHFFHPTTPTAHIADNVISYFSDFGPKSRFTMLDVIFIAGDIFEDILYYRHPDVLIVQALFRRLMAFCLEYGIKLRILEGTPSHDHEQAANFQSIADAFGPDLDYKYIKSLHIEKMRDLNLSILYVPDEWGQNAEDCARQVDELLEAEGLEQVDIGIMHGMFGYQIPQISDHPRTHNEVFYLERVKTYINIGHIHDPSAYDRILAQGSFDCTAHGQEGNKGAIEVKLRMNGRHSYEFIVNPGSMIYKTVRFQDETLDQSADKIRKSISKLPDGSHVRLIAPKGHPILAALSTIKKSYPTFHFKKETSDKKEKTQVDQLAQIIDLGADYVPFSLSRSNLNEKIIAELDKEEPLSELERQLLIQELDALHI